MHDCLPPSIGESQADGAGPVRSGPADEQARSARHDPGARAASGDSAESRNAARPFAGRDAFGKRDCAVRRTRSETGLASTF